MDRKLWFRTSLVLLEHRRQLKSMNYDLPEMMMLGKGQLSGLCVDSESQERGCLVSPLVLFHYPFHLSFACVTVSLLVLGLLLACEDLCPCALCDLGSPGFRTCVAFSHMSFIWRFSFCFLFCCFCFSPYQSIWQRTSHYLFNCADRVNISSCRWWLFVCWLCLVFVFLFAFVSVLFSVFHSASWWPHWTVVLVLQQHGLFWFIFSPRWHHFQLH